MPRGLTNTADSLRQRNKLLEGEVLRLSRVAQKLQADLLAILPVHDALNAKAKVAFSIMEMIGDPDNWKVECENGNERLIWSGPSRPVNIVEEGKADIERSMREIKRRYTVRRIVVPT